MCILLWPLKPRFILKKTAAYIFVIIFHMHNYIPMYAPFITMMSSNLAGGFYFVFPFEKSELISLWKSKIFSHASSIKQRWGGDKIKYFVFSSYYFTWSSGGNHHPFWMYCHDISTSSVRMRRRIWQIRMCGFWLPGAYGLQRMAYVAY